MDRQQIESEAKKLFLKEIELDGKRVDAQEPAVEDIGEAAAELSADALLDRLRDSPSRETDVKLLRRAIDAVRVERAKVLRQLAEYEADIIRVSVAAQRKHVAEREARQQRMIRDLLEFEDLPARQAGKLSQAIDERGTLHLSKTRTLALAVDAEERRAGEVAGRAIDEGQCSGKDADDLISRIVDANGLYPQLGPWTLAPTFESIREWVIGQQKVIRDGANLVGEITYKLVWRAGQIVTKDKFNVQSGFTVARPVYSEPVDVRGGAIPTTPEGLAPTAHVAFSGARKSL